MEIIHGSARFGRSRGEFLPLIYVKREGGAFDALEPATPDYERALEGAFGQVAEYKPTNIVAGSARYYDPPGAKQRVFVERLNSTGKIGDILEPGDVNYARVVDGEFGEIAPYTVPELSRDDLVKIAKAKRDAMLYGDLGVAIGVAGTVKIAGDRLDDFFRTAARAERSPDATFDWTSSAGAVELTAAQILTMRDVLDARDDAARADYAAIISAIDAGTVKTAADIDALWSA